MNVPSSISSQQETIARLRRDIGRLQEDLAHERHLYRCKLIRHIFYLLHIETEVDMEISFPETTSTRSDECCSICLEPLPASPIRELACKHSFHKQCIDRWVHNALTCPMCRDPIQFRGSSSTLMVQLFHLLSEELGV
jgi:hypothetical protein